jgi:hypothetical protein
MPRKARDGSVRALSFRTARRPVSKRRGPDRRGRNPCRRRTAPNFAWSGKKTATLYRVTAPADPVLVLYPDAFCQTQAAIVCAVAGERLVRVKTSTRAKTGSRSIVASKSRFRWLGTNTTPCSTRSTVVAAGATTTPDQRPLRARRQEGVEERIAHR